MAKKTTIVLCGILGLGLHGAANAAGAQSDGPSYALTCPPDFLTDTEQRIYTKEGTVHSGPWHVRCYQNGAAIVDRDRLYVYCGKNQTTASLEGADGHAIRFQFPGEVACVWER